MKIAWKQAAVQLPAVFHAQAVGAIGWILETSGEHDYSAKYVLRQLILEANQLALQELRKEVAREDFQPMDAHILAILLLACLSWGPLSKDEPYMMSPMGQLQQVYAFSCFNTTQAHVLALYSIVHSKGGLASVGARYLRDILEQ
jgi:hypothetical protein